jgi:hypothetical protein
MEVASSLQRLETLDPAAGVGAESSSSSMGPESVEALEQKRELIQGSAAVLRLRVRLTTTMTTTTTTMTAEGSNSTPKDDASALELLGLAEIFLGQTHSAELRLLASLASASASPSSASSPSNPSASSLPPSTSEQETNQLDDGLQQQALAWRLLVGLVSAERRFLDPVQVEILVKHAVSTFEQKNEGVKGRIGDGTSSSSSKLGGWGKLFPTAARGGFAAEEEAGFTRKRLPRVSLKQLERYENGLALPPTTPPDVLAALAGDLPFVLTGAMGNWDHTKQPPASDSERAEAQSRLLLRNNKRFSNDGGGGGGGGVGGSSGGSSDGSDGEGGGGDYGDDEFESSGYLLDAAVEEGGAEMQNSPANVGFASPLLRRLASKFGHITNGVEWFPEGVGSVGQFKPGQFAPSLKDALDQLERPRGYHPPSVDGSQMGAYVHWAVGQEKWAEVLAEFRKESGPSASDGGISEESQGGVSGQGGPLVEIEIDVSTGVTTEVPVASSISSSGTTSRPLLPPPPPPPSEAAATSESAARTARHRLWAPEGNGDGGGGDGSGDSGSGSRSSSLGMLPWRWGWQHGPLGWMESCFKDEVPKRVPGFAPQWLDALRHFVGFSRW